MIRTNNAGKGDAIIIVLMAISLISFAIAGGSRLVTNMKRSSCYKKAVKTYEEGIDKSDVTALENSRSGFSEVQGYKDSDIYLSQIDNTIANVDNYNNAETYRDSGDYAKAIDIYSELGDFKDSEDKLEKVAAALYSKAVDDANSEKYDEALNELSQIPSGVGVYDKSQQAISDIAELAENQKNADIYDSAYEAYKSGDYSSAQSSFMKISDYSNARDFLNAIGDYYYKRMPTLYKNGDYKGLVQAIEMCDERAEYPAGYEKVIQIRDKYKDEYTEKVEKKSLDLLYNNGYGEFKSYINDSINELFDSAAATSILNAHSPVYLSSLTPYEEGEWQMTDKLADIGWSNMGLDFADGVTDDTGHTHSNTLIGGGCSLAYHIGGQYELLTGTMFVQEDCQATSDDPVFLLVRDGNGNDIYKQTLVSGYEPKSFSIDVSGIDDIVIYFDGYTGTFVDNYYYGAVGELALIK